MGGTKKTAWYTIHTKPRQEQVALEHLQNQGFTCFLPLALNPYQKRSRSVGGASAATTPRRGVKKLIKAEPLFPRYLFLEATPGHQNLAPIRSTRGVANLVRFGIKLVEVPEPVIQAIKNKQDPQTGLVQLDPVPVNPGDKVKVFDGPLAGLEGIFQERKGESRALLLMTLLGRQSTIEVEALHLKRAM